MVQAREGKQEFLMFRNYKDRAEKDAKMLLLQASHELSVSNETNKRAVKNGQGGSMSITAPSTQEQTLSIEAVSSHDEVSLMLEDANYNQELLEVWIIDFADKDELGKYGCKYAQGYLQDWTTPSDVEDFIEISTTLDINMKYQKGRVELTPDQVDDVQYAFTDLKKVTPTEEG